MGHPDSGLTAKAKEGSFIPARVGNAGAATMVGCLVFLAMAVGRVQAQQPVLLDHVIAVINGSVILDSDVQEDMRLSVLQTV